MESLIKPFILPPGVMLVGLVIGLVLGICGRRRLGLGLAIVAGLALYLVSIPYVSDNLLVALQTAPALPASGALNDHAGAIVVLGSRIRRNAPEYGGHTVGELSLERLRYAAALYRRTGLPVLVAGGKAHESAVAVADVMADVLEHDFGVPVAYRETRSATTYENARNAAEMLTPAGIKRVYVVTHAWHMPRALASFGTTTLEAIPAPTAFMVTADLSFSNFLPGARHLLNSYYALHEMIGLWWYRLAYGTPWGAAAAPLSAAETAADQ